MGIIERLRCEIERSMQELDRSAKVIESDIEEMNHSLREINTLEDKIALKKKAFFSLECIERVLGSDGLLSRYISRTKISPDIWKKAGYDESIVTAIRTVSNNQFANYKNRIENLITKIDDDSLTVGKDASEATKKDREQEDITTYLNLDSNQKEEWLCKGMQYDTVKELATFIAQSYTEKILCKIPSKKGGGLWNLAKAAFQIEDTATNRKTIENEFNLAYKPPQIPNKFK